MGFYITLLRFLSKQGLQFSYQIWALAPPLPLFSSLLLTTLPVLTGTLLELSFGQLVHMGSVVNATISTISVVVYFCCFVMGFGPIPNILCSEIFPTCVRGLCIPICALTFWIGDVIVTYTLPIILTSIGLAHHFLGVCVLEGAGNKAHAP
ncbi:hypothetical protein PRUPE_7G185800 [Prunus persica]|uniref:Major facilitator superfamily (MFS) profile domain-containing protein n=1 Tax=Prunus persica TaxID=3760 RepID=A0A251NDF9_PRUPE|nr:hypothetical protein PRUPE_7G185800 [Prunus persica]